MLYNHREPSCIISRLTIEPFAGFSDGKILRLVVGKCGEEGFEKLLGERI